MTLCTLTIPERRGKEARDRRGERRGCKEAVPERDVAHFQGISDVISGLSGQSIGVALQKDVRKEDVRKAQKAQAKSTKRNKVPPTNTKRHSYL